MNNTIYTCELMGGLGNQMFQIAHTYSQSIKNNTTCIFKKNSNTQNQGNNVSMYVNNIFKKLNFENNVISELGVFENGFNFTDLKLPPNKSINFHGYYQSSKNFYGLDNIIKELLEPDDNFINKLKLSYPKIFEDNSVSIHIRKGDYKNFPEVHPSISISYIGECVRKFGVEYNFFVFSDDEKWCEDNLNFFNYTFVKLDYDYEELWAISLCKNNIMSNSSFSWWGSYLNKNPSKLVLCPSIWFGPNGVKEYEDVYENDWVKINVYYKEGELLCY